MCSSLSTITKSCNPIIPGIVKAWMCDYSNIISFTTYETHIQSITFSNVFFELPSLKSTTIFDLSIERDFQRGLIKKTSNFSFSLGELSVDNREFIKSLLFKRVVVIIYVNEDYYIIGLNGTLKLDSWNASSGKSQNDFNGYNLNFIDNIHTYGNKKYAYYHVDDVTASQLTGVTLGGLKTIDFYFTFSDVGDPALAFASIMVDGVPKFEEYFDSSSPKTKSITISNHDTIQIVITVFPNIPGSEIIGYTLLRGVTVIESETYSEVTSITIEKNYNDLSDGDEIYILAEG